MAESDGLKEEGVIMKPEDALQSTISGDPLPGYGPKTAKRRRPAEDRLKATKAREAAAEALARLPDRQREAATDILYGSVKKSDSSPCDETKMKARKSPEFRTALLSSLQAMGFGADGLAGSIADGLRAASKSGPEWYARHKYLTTALEIAGAFPAKESSIQVGFEARLSQSSVTETKVIDAQLIDIAKD